MTRELIAHDARVRAGSPIRAGSGRMYLPPIVLRPAGNLGSLRAYASLAAGAVSVVLFVWLAAVALGLAAGGW